MISVLEFTSSFKVGGSEKQAVLLMRHLDKRKYRVLAACLSTEGRLLEHVVEDEIPVVEFKLKRFYDLNAIFQLIKFIKFVKKQRVSIVHTHDFYTNIFGIVGAKLAGVEVVIGSLRDTTYVRSFMQRLVQKMVFRLATMIVVNSFGVKQVLRAQGIRINKIKVIKNCVEIDKYVYKDMYRKKDFGYENHQKLVGVVANLRPEKDHQTFLRAASLIKKEMPSAQFLIVGNGVLRKQLEYMSEQMGLKDDVRFLGERHDIPQIMDLLTVFVLCSRGNEGLPNAILEAMAAGKPIVATDIFGNNELVENGVNGILVPANNPEKLAEKILTVLRDDELAYEMGKRGLLTVKRHHSMEKIINEFELFYDSVSHNILQRISGS